MWYVWCVCMSQLAAERAVSLFLSICLCMLATPGLRCAEGTQPLTNSPHCCQPVTWEPPALRSITSQTVLRLRRSQIPRIPPSPAAVRTTHKKQSDQNSQRGSGRAAFWIQYERSFSATQWPHTQLSVANEFSQRLWHFHTALAAALLWPTEIMCYLRVDVPKCVFLRKASLLGRELADSWAKHFPMSSGVMGSARRPRGSCFVHTRMACLWLPNYRERGRESRQKVKEKDLCTVYMLRGWYAGHCVLRSLCWSVFLANGMLLLCISTVCIWLFSEVWHRPV